MPTKRKHTIVKKQDFPCIPSKPLRILAFLINRSAYSGDAAVKVSAIARDLAIEVDEVVFIVKELVVPGFAVVEKCEIAERAPRDKSVWVATSAEDIILFAESLTQRAYHLKSQADCLRRTAVAMSNCRHPW